jgi:hypothetical protein
MKIIILKNNNNNLKFIKTMWKLILGYGIDKGYIVLGFSVL